MGQFFFILFVAVDDSFDVDDVLSTTVDVLLRLDDDDDDGVVLLVEEPAVVVVDVMLSLDGDMGRKLCVWL